MRDKIWEMVKDLIHSDLQDEVCEYRGLVVFEARVSDIKDEIEFLADHIECKIKAKRS